MTQTIDELQERLSPARLKEQVREQVLEQYRQAKDTVRNATIGKIQDMVERVTDTVYETRKSVADTVFANPIPTALVGIGIAWLWMNRRSDSDRPSRGYDYATRRSRYDEYGRRAEFAASSGFETERRQEWDVGGTARDVAKRAGSTVSGLADQVQEAAGTLASKAKSAVSGVVGQTQEKAGQLANQAQYQTQRVEERFTNTLREDPLAVGAVALAVGTVVGLVVPQSRTENELMGEARDSLVDKAQNVAHDAMDRVQEVAQKVSQEIAPGA